MRLWKFLAVGSIFLGDIALASYNWSHCEALVKDIRDGKQTIGPVNQTTLPRYLHTGPVTGLTNLKLLDDPDYVRITYEGCKVICGNPVAAYEVPVALGHVAAWIFPLAILLNLPYESLHRRKLSGSLVAIINWLGSPQAALTATVFNFRQIRESYRRAYRENNELTHLYSAAYFVLTCVNQYDDGAKLESQGAPQPMLSLLVWGLFRPMSGDGAEDAELTRQLLVNIAFQLRMLRRRGVIPMLANLAVFLVAFIFSLVLTFVELGSGSSSFSFSLAFGLLMTWLPLLVVFSIVDRNPVSSTRSSQLISRWLHNVHFVKTRQDALIIRAAPPANLDWWNLDTVIDPALELGEFIGQGRKLRYCGLPQAFLTAIAEDTDFRRVQRNDLESYAVETARQLSKGKPVLWYVVWITSFLLVWCAIMSAFVVSYRSPTVGLGCRTLVYLLFGFLSSISWAMQLSRHPRRWAVRIQHTFSALSLGSLLVLVVFQVTGVASNSCWCKTSNLAASMGLGGYMDFGDLNFYRDNYDSVSYWTGAAVVGGVVPVMAFIVALFWWMRCNNLWKADERTVPAGPPRAPNGGPGPEADTRWLQ